MWSISYMLSYVIPVICLVIVLPVAGIVLLAIISSILLSVAIYYNVIITLLKK